jgi:hypothetical protein
MKAWEVEVYLNLFLTSELDEDEWAASRHRFIERKYSQCPLNGPLFEPRVRLDFRVKEVFPSSARNRTTNSVSCVSYLATIPVTQFQLPSAPVLEIELMKFADDQ